MCACVTHMHGHALCGYACTHGHVCRIVGVSMCEGMHVCMRVCAPGLRSLSPISSRAPRPRQSDEAAFQLQGALRCFLRGVLARADSGAQLTEFKSCDFPSEASVSSPGSG